MKKHDELHIPANAFFDRHFDLPRNHKATVTVSGTWKYDANHSCGASGNGVLSPDMPNAGAPQGSLIWLIDPFDGGGPQDVRGWFTGDNQTITWGDTSPGNGTYRFSCNDNVLGDNSGELELTIDIEPI